MDNQSNTVTVFVGHDVDDEHESEVLARLRRDLALRGVSACLFANFRTPRRKHQRQIDILVLTGARLTLVELKYFTQHGALLGGVNNRWRQEFADGTVRELEVNPYEQALSAAYAVSDVMRGLCDDGKVPPPAGSKFFKHIDTVVMVYPDIPPGSQLGRSDHATVLGYEQLLDRLVTPGPRPPHWSEANWESFIRRLDLRRLDAGENDPTLVREQHILEDYRRSLIGTLTAGLPQLVTLSAQVDGEYVDTFTLAAYTRHGQMVTLLGGSGAGKSHVARHTAVQLSRDGALVLWTRCADAPIIRLSAMLARATGPHSTEKALTLVDTAVAHGRDAVLILDGLNECSPAKRDVLLGDLAALRRRHRVSVIITSTEAVAVPSEDLVRTVALLAPGPVQRAAILDAYGAAGRPSDYAAAFTTPLELSMAALCARDLPPEATRAELYRAFVRTRCPSTAARGVLRTVARLLDEQLRGSLPLDRLQDHLERDHAAHLQATAIDDALESPLLVVEHAQVRFSHELLARFLAAVELAHRPLEGAALAALLTQPGHGDLVEFVVDLEPDPARRYAVITHLQRDDLLRAGLIGGYGTEVASRVRADTRAAFSAATAATAGAQLEVDDPRGVSGRWMLTAALPSATAPLIAAATAELDRGEFLDDLAKLLVAADDAVDISIAGLRADGRCPDPDSLVVASSYGFQYQPRHPFPATLVIDILEQNKFRRLGRHPGRRPLAAQLWNSAHQHRPGLIVAALQLADATLTEDRAILLDLLETAWQTPGYHLRLATLDAVHRLAHDLAEHDPELHHHVREFLDAIPDTGNLALNGMFIECLDAYGLVEPQITAADITRQINALVTADPSPELDEFAYGLWSSQFEDEVVAGPVHQVLHDLARNTRAQLLTMATRGRPPYGWFGALLIHQLAEVAGPGDAAAIAAISARATTLDMDTSFQQDAIGFHAEAVIALAGFTPQLPPAPDHLMPPVWRLIDELLHAAARCRLELGEAGDVAAMSQWNRLETDHAAETVEVLHALARAMSCDGPGHDTAPYPLLRTASPEPLRRVLERTLHHPEVLPAPPNFLGEQGALMRFVMTELGTLGDETTATALEAWTADPDLGVTAIEVIRRLRTPTPPSQP